MIIMHNIFTSGGITGKYFSKLGSNMYGSILPSAIANICMEMPKKEGKRIYQL